ncbi:hypothetical protein McanMca71_003914 [Microsporum canis]
MKFEENFLLFQVPEWGSYYLPYRKLKGLLKLATDKSHVSQYGIDLSEFSSSFSNSLAGLGMFSEGQFTALRGKEEAIFEPYRRVCHGPGSQIPNSRLLYAELLEQYTRLQLFNRLNYEASQRIYAKAEKVNKSFPFKCLDEISRLIEEQPSREKKCLEEMERLKVLIDDISLTNEESRSSVQITRCLIHFSDEHPEALPYLTAINNSIAADQASDLGGMFGKLKFIFGTSSKPLIEELFYESLAMSFIFSAWSCTKTLIESSPAELGSWVDHTWLNGLLRAIHRPHLQSLIRKGNASMSENHISHKLGTELFRLMLDLAGIQAKDILLTPDAAGMSTLHYSAQYGLPTICESIIKALHCQDIPLKPAILAADAMGITPLHWSVIQGHVHITRLFLATLDGDGDDSLNKTLSHLLLIAIKYQYDEIVRLLASRCINMDQISNNGETCLHVACQTGREDYIDILLEAASRLNGDVDVQEIAYGWTPLITASVKGYIPIVEALLRVGANERLLDYRGWTAKEHAAFRGHFAVANRLEVDKPLISAIGRPYTAASNHKLQDGTTYLVVNLGVVQKRRQVKPLDLKHLLQDLSQELLNTTLSLEISTSPKGVTQILRVPLLGDLIDDTLLFPIDNLSEAYIMFKLFRNTSFCTGDTLIGSGIALLRSRDEANCSHHESLVRESTVPILAKETMKLLGTITFTSFIATPFSRLNTPTSSFEYLKQLQSTQLIGHRGSGQNTGDRDYLQLGENTIQSFISAANLGASHVEFDVQLTRDLVPVLYHDLSLSESGTDIAIHDLTLKQFIHTSTMQLSPGDSSNDSRSRSRSLSRNQREPVNEARERMKHTIYFSSKGFKPNTRGDFIQTPLATLEEALREVPEGVGFDIELKYPRIHEASAIEISPIAIDLNTFVDTILNLISSFAGSRNIILSSFTPEICILLAMKQKAYPIFFITNAGKLPVADLEERAGSLQVAVRFATQWGLAGLVLASDVLVMCPQLVGYVKGKGLVCATYGPLNNVPESVKVQAKAGVDLIVADRVGLISKALKSLG